MKSVGAYAAKTHLSSLLARVARGEHITITRHGMPVAVLTPPEAQSSRSVEEVIEEIREFRKGNKLRGLSIRKMVEEGRR
jgi:prevent-host-death family protein